MKYCPYCGAGLDVDMCFCPKCGKPFEDGRENPHLTGKHVKETPAAPVRCADAPKKKKRGGIVALVVILLLAALAGGLYVGGVFAPKKIAFSDDTAAIAKASESVVMLSCYDKDGELYATGSGFAVFDDGVIVTNYHVIEQEVWRVTAQTEAGLSFECPTVLAFDAEKDVAILKADRETGLSLLTPGSTEGLQKGEKLVAIGSPLGLINSVSTGVFSGYVDDVEGRLLQFTAAISHGSSGGALFNDAGEVVGVTFASLEDGQSINLAVPIESAKALYESAGTTKQMSMEAFYDTFDHTPPIPTYTVGYVLEHYKELDGQTMYVEGYVSSISYGIDMVDSAGDVLGIVFDEKGFFGEAYPEWTRKEETRIDTFQALQIPKPDDVGFNIAPGDKLSVLCQLEVAEEDRSNPRFHTGAWRLHFSISGYSVLNETDK